MQVYWLEQTEADVPEGAAWLSPAEVLRLGSLRIPKRRTDWLLGRWTAKCTVAAFLGADLRFAGIEVRPDPAGAPQIVYLGCPTGLAISISHCRGVACCAIAERGGTVGCDLEWIEARDNAFVADYFTMEEQAVVGAADSSDRPRLATLIWSAKESALKALRTGLRADTRSVAVHVANGTGRWHPLRVRHSAGEFRGWWQVAGSLVRTVVTDPACGPPLDIRIGQRRP
jgi:4'-phosphopantetheinyl transferase